MLLHLVRQRVGFLEQDARPHPSHRQGPQGLRFRILSGDGRKTLPSLFLNRRERPASRTEKRIELFPESAMVDKKQRISCLGQAAWTEQRIAFPRKRYAPSVIGAKVISRMQPFSVAKEMLAELFSSIV